MTVAAPYSAGGWQPTNRKNCRNTVRVLALLLVAALAACTPARRPTSSPQAVGRDVAHPARARANDNRVAAGILHGGVLRVHLVAQLAAWYPEAEDGPFKVVEAFGEAGRAPLVPAPLIRIPLGTTIDATITNSLTDTLIVLGLRGRGDSLRIAPNQTRRVRHRPTVVGSFLYAAGNLDSTGLRFGGASGQLAGGLIIDSAGTASDRVLIATGWDPVTVGGSAHFLAMNGKSWPYTERFVHAVGDTVRWRVLNAGNGSSAHHPMHLHGFYYRVDARGGWDADTIYRRGQDRWVVTENLPERGSMAMTWVPVRAGNWLFHCHNADHVAGTNRHYIAGTPRPHPAAPTHDAQEHLARDMSGLVNAITILPRAGRPIPGAPVAPNVRRLRLLIQERARYYGRGPGYGYVLQEGATEPAVDSIRIPGPQLVLRRGEPVQITLVNRLATHTAVHWHGIELESFFDGVAGWSGAGDRLAPMIAPEDSFIVTFTPPRAGTFIYHAHITDHVQIARGLYGALIVVPADTQPVSGTDHVAVIGFGRPNGKAGILLNGSNAPAPMERRRAGTHRLRIINITTENNVVVTLSDGATQVTWRAVAKDGFELPMPQQRTGPAEVRLFPGETYDFEFESSADVLRLRVMNPNVEEGDDDVFLDLRAQP